MIRFLILAGLLCLAGCGTSRPDSYSLDDKTGQVFDESGKEIQWREEWGPKPAPPRSIKVRSVVAGRESTKS